MATSRTRKTAGASARRTTSQSTGRSARRGADAGGVEVVEEAGGMDWDTGVSIVTALILIAALVLLDYEMGRNLGGGILFK